MTSLSQKLRRPAPLVLGLFFLPQICAGQGTQKTQTDAVAAVSQHLRDGDTGGALALAQQALQTHPANCALWSLAGLAHLGRDEQTEALQSFSTALHFCPAYLPALEGAAQIRLHQQSPEVVPLLEHVLALQPANSQAHAMLATAFAAQRECPKAMPHFVAAEKLLPTNPGLQQAYAGCLVRENQFNEALMQLKQLSAADPDPANVFNVALVEWKLNQPQEALATLQPLLLHATLAPALALAARVEEAVGDTPSAVAHLRSALVLQPTEIEYYLDFARIAFAHKSFQVGIDVVSAGIRETPSSASLYLARGVLEMQISQEKQALADFHQAHTLEPNLALTQDALGIVQTQQHDPAATLTLLRDQAEAHPADPLLQFLYAEQLAAVANAPEKNLQEAIAAAQHATTLDAAYLPAHDLLAKLYLRAGQPRLAIQEAEAALRYDPEDQEALYQELLARRKAGDTAEMERLLARLKRARARNAEKEQSTDRYHLIEGSGGQGSAGPG